jgi:hypothetical protein
MVLSATVAMATSKDLRASIKAFVKVDNFNSWKVPELKQACRDAHVAVGGTKAVLIDRLRAVQQYCAPYFRAGGD